MLQMNLRTGWRCAPASSTARLKPCPDATGDAPRVRSPAFRNGAVRHMPSPRGVKNAPTHANAKGDGLSIVGNTDPQICGEGVAERSLSGQRVISNDAGLLQELFC
jgi:hypothetical protein